MGILQIFFIALMIALYTSQNFFCSKYSASYPGEESCATPVLTVVVGILVPIVSFCFSGFRFDFSLITVLFGIANSLALYGYNLFLMKGAIIGPYSVLITFALVGPLVISPLVNLIFFNEGMTGPSMVFVAIVIIAVYLVSVKENEGGKITPKFLLVALALAVCNGVYASILSSQQRITGENQKEELVMVMFAMAGLISAIQLISRKVNIKSAFRQTKKSFCFLMIYALSAALAINSLVIILALKINTGVLYTIENAGVMLLSVLLSVIFMKEKLSKKNVVGCILLAIGLVGTTAFAQTTFSDIAKMF